MKKREAPGELEQVRAFVNTVELDEADGDELTSPAALREWLTRNGLAAADVRFGPSDLHRAIDLREALRRVLLAHNGEGPIAEDICRVLDDAARRARLRLRFDEHGGAQLEPEAGGIDGALGRLLAIVQRSIADGTWERLKACRDHTCEWAFYDHTKNRSGAWCNMEVCGNRAKARAYRQRHALS